MDDERGLDRALEEALQSYAAEEPRPGLERRVLARVRIEAAGSQRPNRWRMISLVSAAVCLVILCVFAFQTQRHTKPANIGSSRPALVPRPQVAAGTGSHLQNPVPRVVRAHHSGALRPYSPRKEVFPTPEPLSPQERLLVTYAAASARVSRQSPIVAKEPIHLEPIRIAEIHIDPLPPASGSHPQ